MLTKEQWIDRFMGQMNLEQKVGQLMVFGFCGATITPDVVELLKKYHVGGLRISQGFRIITLTNDIKPGEEPDEITMKSMHFANGLNRDFAFNKPAVSANAYEYAQVLNQLRSIALENNDGIPLHFTIDQEGSGSDDLLGGQRLFPHPMGLAATNDPQYAYKAALAIGRQARAVGANMLHSPVLDVNSNPLNPEIGTRAYADNAKTVTDFALQSLKGFQEAGIISTGKHFPGRGESTADAHWGLPAVTLNEKQLKDEHISPYIKLIEAGLPAIMSAHSVYPALGENERPASLSRKILTDFLRGELGFKGIITTDNMMMGGILKQYEMSEAIVEALIAGNDLILTRDETPIRKKVLETVKAAVKSGRLPEKELDEKVQRILAMRWDMGLAENGGVVEPQKALDITNEKEVVEAAVEIAEKSVLKLRDNDNLLPLPKNKRILLVEQIFPTQAAANSMYCHPGMLWEAMCNYSENVGSIELNNVPTEMDKIRLKRRLENNDFDIIVTTNYYYHKAAASITDLVKQMQETGKPVVVITNTPYAFGADDAFPTILTCFQSGGKEHLEAVAKILFGQLDATAQTPVKL